MSSAKSEEFQQELVNNHYEIVSMGYDAGRASGLSPAKLWHLGNDAVGGANFVEAWKFALGAGVTIGIVDDGTNSGHADLAWAYDGSLAYDPRDLDGTGTEQVTSQHGTYVAGVIAGDMSNDIAGVGGAQASHFTTTHIRYGAGFVLSELAEIVAHQVNVDVSNNSWGFASAFADNFSNAAFSRVAQAMQDVASQGRDGLGTVMVFAAGNGKIVKDGVSIGDDSGFHSLTGSRFTIAVGAHGEDGAPTAFSSPGANVLLTAPGTGLLTATGASAGATTQTFQSGTSFAAPLVSSVVALMLSENPDLGYRDVQEILALSASSRVGGSATSNGATNFNGGGLMFDREGGFGMLDAAAAVHLARNWDKQSTAANEQHLQASFDPPGNPDPSFAVLSTILEPTDERGFSVDHVELELNLYDRALKDLTITLISPDGTRTEIAESMASIGSRSTLKFSFGSVANWGENPFGEWKVELKHANASPTFMAFDAKLHVYGDYDTPDDTHFITGSFAKLVALDASRAILDDTDGGIDTLNFAAAKAAAFVDLSGASASHIDGVEITLKGTFENVIGTIRSDTIHGSDAANRLVGDFGNDRLHGLAGDDWLFGGHGNDALVGGAGSDWLVGGAGIDTMIFEGSRDDFDIVRNGNDYLFTDAAGDVDVVSQAEFFVFDDMAFNLIANPDLDPERALETDVAISLERGASLASLDLDETMPLMSELDYALADLPNAGHLRLANGRVVTSEQVLSESDLAGLTYSASRGGARDQVKFTISDDTRTLETQVRIDVTGSVSKSYFGNAGANLLDGANGNDKVYGLAGNDMLLGGSGYDHLMGGTGSDRLIGGLGRDVLTGGTGRDTFEFSSALGRANADHIRDFSRRSDQISLDHDVFKSLNAGDLKSSEFKDIAKYKLDASDHILYNSKTGNLFYDADGRGGHKAQLIATFDNHAKLNFHDFDVV